MTLLHFEASVLVTACQLLFSPLSRIRRANSDKATSGRASPGNDQPATTATLHKVG